MTRLILFLIRLKLGLRKYDLFTFINQTDDAIYCIGSNIVLKHEIDDTKKVISQPADVSINVLLNSKHSIKKL